MMIQWLQEWTTREWRPVIARCRRVAFTRWLVPALVPGDFPCYRCCGLGHLDDMAMAVAIACGCIDIRSASSDRIDRHHHVRVQKNALPAGRLSQFDEPHVDLLFRV